MTTTSDRIREYVVHEIIQPARERGEPLVTIDVGEVHRRLGLKQRVPLVISALKARKFLREQGLELERLEGPPSGQSSTVKIVLRLLPGRRAEEGSPDALERLYGAGKQLFAELGGGEAFLRRMRENFRDASDVLDQTPAALEEGLVERRKP